MKRARESSMRKPAIVSGIAVLTFLSCLAAYGSTGQFQLAPQYPAGFDPLSQNPWVVATADFNGDGRPDLAILRNGGSEVSILLGNSDGTFQPPVNYQTDYVSGGILIADLNGDGYLDLVIFCGGVFFHGEDGTVEIFLGNGDGTFRPRVDYPLGASPDSWVLGDFNGDGAIDIAVASNLVLQTPVTFRVLLNAGDGTFPTSVEGQGTVGSILAAGDFNGDGKTDLVVGNTQYDSNGQLTQSTVSVLPGNGDGTFQSALSLSMISIAPITSVTTDFNGDGHLDVALLGSPQAGGTVISVLLGTGSGTFGESTDHTVSGHFPFITNLAAADVDGDGHLDLAWANYYENDVIILHGDGKGGFSSPSSYLAHAATGLVAADVNGDGRPDLSVIDYDGNAITELLNAAKGFPNEVYAAGNQPIGVAIGDVNGDGKADVVVVSGTLNSVENAPDNTVSVLLGNGDGSFQPRAFYATGPFPFAVAVGDLNGDGKADVVVTNLGDNTVSVFLSGSNGKLQGRVDYPAGNGPSSVVIGDFNADGKPDLAVCDFADNTVSVLLGNGDGTFRPRVTYATDPAPINLAIGDFNGDGKLDLATANNLAFVQNAGFAAGTVSVLLGNGDGTFGSHVESNIGGALWAIATGDLNGDKKDDIIVSYGYQICNEFTCDSSSGIGVLVSRGDGTFNTVVSYPSNLGPSKIAVADFNGDGKPDLAVANGDFAVDGISHGNTVSIFYGRGDATFRPKADYGVGLGSYALAIGDLNGDHKPDLAVVAAGAGKIFPLLNAATATQFVLTTAAANGTLIQATSAGPEGCGSSCSYDSGTIVNLQSGTAVTWTGDCTGNGGCVVDMTADHMVGDTIPTSPNYNLNLNIGGNGVGSVQDQSYLGHVCNTSCVITVPPETVLALGAAAIPGNVLGSWSAPECGKHIDCYVTMTSDMTITATFNLPSGFHQLTVTGVGGSGSITSSPGGINCSIDPYSGASGACEAGFSGSAPVTLSFSPGTDYVLTGWSGGGCSGTGNCVLTLSSNQTVTANIAPVPDFSWNVSSFSPDPVSAGQTATTTLSLNQINGFSGSVSLACAVAPSPQLAPVCSLNPASLDSNNTTTTVTVTTTAPTSAAMRSVSGGANLMMALVLPASFAFLSGMLIRKRRGVSLLLTLLFSTLLASTLLQLACGGSNTQSTTGGGRPGTPPGNYTITITGTSGSLQHSASVSLIVQ